MIPIVRLGISRKTLSAILLILAILLGCTVQKEVVLDGKTYAKDQLLDSGLKYVDKRAVLGKNPKSLLSIKYDYLGEKYIKLAIQEKDFRRKKLRSEQMSGLVHLSGIYYHEARQTKDFSKFISLYKKMGDKYVKKNPELAGRLESYWHFVVQEHPEEFIAQKSDTLNHLLYRRTPYRKYLSERNLLEKVYDDDQKYRKILFGKAEEADSLRKKRLLDSMEIADHRNFVIVDSILRKKGWLDIGKIGKKASDGVFMVIQHLDTPAFYNYEKIVEKALKRSNISKAKYVLYIDRYYVYKYGYQLYGTQSRYDKKLGKELLFPLKDSVNVNSLREKMGFSSLKLY